MGLALAACATDTASRTEVNALAAELRSARLENARLEGRLDKLEQQLVVASARPAVKSPPVGSAAGLDAPKPEAVEMPSLTVVKLKPKREKAPSLPTQVEISEPPEGLVAAVEEPATSAAQLDEAQTVVADDRYEAGLSALKTGDVEGGVKSLKAFAAEWPKHPRADNALYFAGVGHLALAEFDSAEKAFTDVIARYPAGDALLDSLLKLAECRMKLKRPREARATWEKIVSSFPGTAAASQAQQRLAAVPASKQAEPD